MSLKPGEPTVTDVTGNSLVRVLLVEADAVISGRICQLLGRLGFSVSGVRCLRDALGQLESPPAYSAIICEYYLPDGTGLELLDRLRDNQDLRVPMLLVSGNWTRPLPSYRGLEFLTKPFDTAQLLRALHQLLDQSRMTPGALAGGSPRHDRPEAHSGHGS